MSENVKIPEVDSWDLRIQNIANSLSIPAESVKARLAKWGIPEDDIGFAMLDDEDVVKFGDFVTFFGTADDRQTAVPMAWLRMAFKFLRSGKKSADRLGIDVRLLEPKNLGYKVKMEDADLATLLRAYRPDLPNDPVTNVLRKRFGDKPAVAFKEDGTVAVEETAGFWADVEQGLATPGNLECIMVDGRPEELQPVGVNPNKNQVLDEDPLFPGQALRAERSQVNFRSWSKVKYPARAFCRLVLNDGLIEARNNQAVLKLIEAAEAGVERLAEIYPEVDIKFWRLTKQDDLPELKVRPNRNKPNNLFGINRKY